MRAEPRYVPLFEELPLPARLDPWAVFRALGGGAEGSFFLQMSRAEGETHRPAQTILAFDPFETVRVRGGRARIETEDGVSELEGEPFGVVSQRLEEYRAAPQAGLPFFTGGALGYFSYDSVRFLEPSLCAGPGNLKELSGTRKAGSAGYDAELMLFRKLAVFEHASRKLYLISGVLPARESMREGSARARKELAELKRRIEAVEPAAPRRAGKGAARTKPAELPMSALEAMLGRARYLAGVKTLKKHIRDGDIFQAVLSDKLSAPFAGDPLELFESLSGLAAAPYRFYFASGESVFMGASPEMLLKVRGGELETHPIAGTRPRGATKAEEKRFESQLLRSEKERAEHLMLVDLARNDVGRVSEPGTVKVAEYMSIHKFGGVMHLVSRVTGKMSRDSDAIAALAACFPAGTLSGAPKIRAMQLLSGLEPEPRGFYGGAVVAASFTGELDSCISIRSLQLTGGRAIVQAGAGIVADSQPAREYGEITQKSLISRRALAGARAGEPS